MPLLNGKSKEDVEWNSKFIQLVKDRPCLYDHNLPDFPSKSQQDAAWNVVADSMESSVKECRHRWRVLKACFTRCLRYPEQQSKPYYLAKQLDFLKCFLPVGKNKPNLRSIKGEVVEPEIEPDMGLFYDDGENEENQTNELFPEEKYSKPEKNNTPMSSKRRRRSSQVILNDSSLQFLQNALKPLDMIGDPDLMFLHSMLPEVKAMNNEQKRRFKIEMITLADSIIKDNFKKED